MVTTRSWLLPSLVLVVGCATPQPKALIHESWKTTSSVYRRVVIVPIWFSASARCDRTLTSNELARAACDGAKESAVVVTKLFADRGYQVLAPAQSFCSEDDLKALDPETRELLAQVRADFRQLTRQACEAVSANVPDLALRHKLTAPLRPLQLKLGEARADVLVLVDVSTRLEATADRRSRHLYNVTVAPVMTAALGALSFETLFDGTGVPDPTAIRPTIAIVDLRTNDVLLWHSITANGADFRNSDQLRNALSTLFAGVPALPP